GSCADRSYRRNAAWGHFALFRDRSASGKDRCTRTDRTIATSVCNPGVMKEPFTFSAGGAALGMAVGLGAGALIGTVAFDSAAIGIAVGIALGAALGGFLAPRRDR